MNSSGIAESPVPASETRPQALLKHISDPSSTLESELSLLVEMSAGSTARHTVELLYELGWGENAGVYG